VVQCAAGRTECGSEWTLGQVRCELRECEVGEEGGRWGRGVRGGRERAVGGGDGWMEEPDTLCRRAAARV